MQWLMLVLSLPTDNATARMRIWRALKASGASVLRDGVYLLPDRESCRGTLQSLATDVLEADGNANLLEVAAANGTDFSPLFDRGPDYAALLPEAARLAQALSSENAIETRRLARKLRKRFAALVEIDFFPGEARLRADAALSELEQAITTALAPDEPIPVDRAIASLRPESFRGRTWATRRRPWVDRLASAWLIRRFVDPQARFLWLETPADCPPDALGFDFDGATFSHVGERVTFETLLASFGLENDPRLARIARIVHYLDVGGLPVPEAAGVETLLDGMRATLDDDDELANTAAQAFDFLYHSANSKEPA